MRAEHRQIAFGVGLSLAILAAALMWSKEHEASLEAVRKAIRLNPHDAVAQAMHGILLNYVGDYQGSIEALEREERLNPFVPALGLVFRAIPRIMLGEFEAAARLTRSCAQRSPRNFSCFLYLAIATSELGLHDEAQEAARQLLVLYPKFRVEHHIAAERKMGIGHGD